MLNYQRSMITNKICSKAQKIATIYFSSCEVKTVTLECMNIYNYLGGVDVFFWLQRTS